MERKSLLALRFSLFALLFAPVLLFAQGEPAPNPNCSLIVPTNPLSAEGLATPYQLVATDSATGECHEANPKQSAFVQAAILDPATGQVSIYNPLVIDKDTAPGVLPVVPMLPSDAVVGIWFGYNGDVLTLNGASGALSAAGCVNGLPNSNFGQFAYCNAPAFFKAAHRLIRSGKLTVPALGVAVDGLPCPSVRDFFVVDQDQSDNLPTTYLLTGIGVAQKTQVNIEEFPTAPTLGNPSDNRLVDVALDGALGCTPWKAADLADPGQLVPALALNELQARADQISPVALVPAGDPMVLDNGSVDLRKVNAYRRGVDQPQARHGFQASTERYCRHIFRKAPARLLLDQQFLVPRKSPDPAVADSLFTFMGQRFVATYDILGCANLLHVPDPVSVTVDSAGVTIGVTIDTTAYARHKRYLTAYELRDSADDDAGKARAATE
jgi:hypothetical protein